MSKNESKNENVGAPAPGKIIYWHLPFGPVRRPGRITIAAKLPPAGEAGLIEWGVGISAPTSVFQRKRGRDIARGRMERKRVPKFLHPQLWGTLPADTTIDSIARCVAHAVRAELALGPRGLPTWMYDV